MFRNFVRVTRPIFSEMAEIFGKRFKPQNLPKNVKPIIQKSKPVEGREFSTIKNVKINPPKETTNDDVKTGIESILKESKDADTKSILSSLKDKFKINFDRYINQKENSFSVLKNPEKEFSRVSDMKVDDLIKKARQDFDFLNPTKNTATKQNGTVESLNKVAQEISNLSGKVGDLVDKTLVEEKNRGVLNTEQLQAIKNNINNIENVLTQKGDEQVQLLKDLIKNLYQLTEQTIISRKESTNKLENIAKIDKEELEKILAKMDESFKADKEETNDKLGMLAAYATILSLVVGVLGLAYQHVLETDKKEEAQLEKLEQLNFKLQNTQKKIEQVQLEYSSLLNKKTAIESSIKSLEKRKEDLVQMEKTRWLPNMGMATEINHLDQKIDQKKIELDLALKDLDKLDVYVEKQKNKSSNQPNKAVEEKPEETQEPENFFRPF